MIQKYLLYSSSIADAMSEVTTAGGFVPIQLSDRAFIATFPDDFDISNLKLSSVEKPEDLDENTSILASAWEEAEKRINEKQILETKEIPLKWDDKDHQYPRNPKNDPILREHLKKNGIVEITPESTSQTLNGKVAVGILIVSGPKANLQFTSTEYTQVVSEVLEGLFFLAASCYEASLNFVTVTYNIPISSTPICDDNNGCQGTNAEKCEAVFRDPALAYLGYPSGNDGCVQLTKSLQSTFKAKWAYISFFAKYPMYNFAYQYSVNIFMQYSNNGWGPDKINQVFAHETAHVFGADDEYASSGCTCDVSGTYKVPNNNCANCAYTPKVICLMNQNDLTLCNWTRGQLGWGYWNLPFKNIIDDGEPRKTSSAPALAYLSGKMFMAVRRDNPGNGIRVLISSDGITWPVSHHLDDTKVSTCDSPALAVFNNKLYLFWRTNDSNNQIKFAYSPDGINWTIPTNNTLPGQSTSAAPAAASFNGKLYVFWRANIAANTIYYMASSDGTTWPSTSTSLAGNSTLAAPAAAVLGSKLFVFWKSNDTQNKIYKAYSTDGKGWVKDSAGTGMTIPNQTTSASPAIASFNNRLYLAWKAADANDTTSIYYGSSTDGINWGQQFPKIDSTSTSAAPAIAGFGTKYLNMALKASGTGNEILTDNFLPGLF
ncbi:MAG: exo-alpha-sialidase [Bacteroidetes bacterium]|nr:exo-alpha-sialidase [Bacteroidota bacterium]